MLNFFFILLGIPTRKNGNAGFFFIILICYLVLFFLKGGVTISVWLDRFFQKSTIAVFYDQYYGQAIFSLPALTLELVLILYAYVCMYCKLSYENLQIVNHFYSLYFFKYLIEKNIACIMIFFFKGGAKYLCTPINKEVRGGER